MTNLAVDTQWIPVVEAAMERKRHRERDAHTAERLLREFIRDNNDAFAPPGFLVSRLAAQLQELDPAVPHEAYLQAISNACRAGALHRVLPGRLLLPE